MDDTAILGAEKLLEAQTWRYATKKFDPGRKIPATTWEALERSLSSLTPSSFGLQPWRFVVVTDPALKARLRPATWNQVQVEECSDLVVFLARTGVGEADVDRLLARTAEVRAPRGHGLPDGGRVPGRIPGRGREVRERSQGPVLGRRSSSTDADVRSTPRPR